MIRDPARAIDDTPDAEVWIIFDVASVSAVTGETVTEDDLVVWRIMAMALRASACSGTPTMRARDVAEFAVADRKREDAGFADANTVTASTKDRNKTDFVAGAGSADADALRAFPAPRDSTAD